MLTAIPSPTYQLHFIIFLPLDNTCVLLEFTVGWVSFWELGGGEGGVGMSGHASYQHTHTKVPHVRCQLRYTHLASYCRPDHHTSRTTSRRLAPRWLAESLSAEPRRSQHMRSLWLFQHRLSFISIPYAFVCYVRAEKPLQDTLSTDREREGGRGRERGGGRGRETDWRGVAGLKRYVGVSLIACVAAFNRSSPRHRSLA